MTHIRVTTKNVAGSFLLTYLTLYHNFKVQKLRRSCRGKYSCFGGMQIFLKYSGKFAKGSHRGLWTRLRPGATFVYAARLDRSWNGDVGDVHSLGDRSSNQSRVSTRTSSRRDRLCHRQTETTDLGRPDSQYN